MKQEFTKEELIDLRDSVDTRIDEFEYVLSNEYIDQLRALREKLIKLIASSEIGKRSEKVYNWDGSRKE